MAELPDNTTTANLLVLGTGSQGRVEADLAESCDWKNIAFVHDEFPVKANIDDWPIVGTYDDLPSLLSRFPYATAGFGNNDRRIDWANRLIAMGFKLPTLIHPSASISPRATIAPGCVIMANVAVNIGAQIGRSTILNTGSSVDHDCVLGDGVHISPGAHLAGTVMVGDRSWIGVGASIKNNITIGSGCVIGAGATVIRDVPDGRTVVGVPARALGGSNS